jgi:hypothetical protein
MRIYLMASLGLGLLLPIITLPVSIYGSQPVSESLGAVFNMAIINADTALFPQNSGNVFIANDQLSIGSILGYGLILVYISGVFYRLVQLIKKLLHIRNSIRNNQRIKRGKLWFIYLETTSPAYSFFNYVFINKHLERLSSEELVKIYNHESIHASQYHTLDILFVELVSILFWFNPMIKMFKNNLLEIHEYLADEKIIKSPDMRKSYSHLLLKLSSEENPPILSSAFSAKQISRRISMIGKARSLPRHRFSFLLLLPAAAFLLISFSSVENRYSTVSASIKNQTAVSSSIMQMKVGVITWTNNTLHTDDQLTERLGIKSGDAYSKEYLEQRLYLDEDAVNSLYMDNGYLFFQVEVEEAPKDDGTMDLTITLYEGVQAHIRQITIVGNGSVPKEDVLKEILIQEHELFSKTKLIESVRAIARMGLFDPENIAVNPTPIKDEVSDELNKVDIEFKLAEK